MNNDNDESDDNDDNDDDDDDDDDDESYLKRNFSGYGKQKFLFFKNINKLLFCKAPLQDVSRHSETFDWSSFSGKKKPAMPSHTLPGGERFGL